MVIPGTLVNMGVLHIDIFYQYHFDGLSDLIKNFSRFWTTKD